MTLARWLSAVLVCGACAADLLQRRAPCPMCRQPIAALQRVEEARAVRQRE